MIQGFRVTIMVGTGTDKYGLPIKLSDAARALARIRIKLAQAFGGYTETAHNGGWVNPEGDLVQETSVSFTTIIDETKVAEIPKAAEWARVLLLQEQVLVTLEPVQYEFATAG